MVTIRVYAAADAAEHQPVVTSAIYLFMTTLFLHFADVIRKI